MRIVVSLVLVAAAAAIGALARGGSSEAARPGTLNGSNPAGITERNLPAGFTKAPTVVVKGKRYRFDTIPGHYWKVLGKGGYAVGLHFQTDKPFAWARGVPKGELLYLIYAVPGTCGNGNYARAIRSRRATAVGPLPPGFDHWHGFVEGGSRVGTWYTHIPVRDFTLAGPAGNPAAGTRIKAGTPRFIPVCDIVQ